MATILLFLALLIFGFAQTGAQSIGVCYGRFGNNLPTEQEVIELYKSNGIGKMRIYDPNQATLQALKGSNIELILDVPRDQLQSLTTASGASDWVQKNIISYWPDVKFKYIAVGNEIKPSETEAPFVLPAMQNIQTAISSASLQSQIKVSTAIDMSLVGNTVPPSNAIFNDASYISPIVNFLVTNGSPLLANVYPYFAHIFDPKNVQLPYALFTSPGTVFQDNGLPYQNLFDALVDSVYSALEKVGGASVKVVVSESGWPSEGGAAASVENAGTYYRNLVGHVNKGTPKKSGQAIETYLFAMFDENNKAPGTEQHFGLFTGTQPKYQVTFN